MDRTPGEPAGDGGDRRLGASTVLDDDTRPHDIVYRSRHAGGDVHAFWFAAVDCGLPAFAQPVTADAGGPITAADPDLLAHRPAG